MSANIYILLSIVVGNLTGSFLSYRSQQKDEHDVSGDLNEILALVHENGKDARHVRARKVIMDLTVLIRNQEDTGPRKKMSRLHL
jgi:hypothetical protein